MPLIQVSSDHPRRSSVRWFRRIAAHELGFIEPLAFTPFDGD
jgi:hypothetical protein